MANDPAKPASDTKDGVDPELGFDPDSPDASDPDVDPTHPALTDNDPVPTGKIPRKPE